MIPILPHLLKSKINRAFSFLRKDYYWVKTPNWLKKIYPQCVWDIDLKYKTLYITFDDGPHPFITPFVLDELKKYNAFATFFCIGDNVKKFPQNFRAIQLNGHVVGNHTMHHLKGWQTADINYVNDVIEANAFIGSSYFRPPYGRIKKSQIKKLCDLNYKIIMWNILAGDWDNSISAQKCFDRMVNKIKDGDIVVFHDSEKAWPLLQNTLPLILKYFSDKGYSFKPLPY